MCWALTPILSSTASAPKAASAAPAAFQEDKVAEKQDGFLCRCFLWKPTCQRPRQPSWPNFASRRRKRGWDRSLAPGDIALLFECSLGLGVCLLVCVAGWPAGCLSVCLCVSVCLRLCVVRNWNVSPCRICSRRLERCNSAK